MKEKAERLKEVERLLEAHYWRFSRCAGLGRWPTELYRERFKLEEELGVPHGFH